jgi:hypothetical protein
LAICGFWFENGRLAFLIAAAICFVVTAFSVWRAERMLRIKLEQESGPHIFVEVARANCHILTFRNTGDEPAKNLELALPDDTYVQMHMRPAKIPVVHSGESQEAYVTYSRQPQPNETVSGRLIDFMRDNKSFETLSCYALFESSKGTRFRVKAEMKRMMMSFEGRYDIVCFQGPRELIG